MIFRVETLERIRAGTVTLAFRRWRRPTVRAGGTLLTAVGQLRIDAVDPIDPASITDAEAVRAGFASREELLALLGAGDGTVYRVTLGHLGIDPRVGLRQDSTLSASDVAGVLSTLDRLDRGARSGPWTRTALELIEQHPGVRAGSLAERLGSDTLTFKRNVRKLKALGLTESLEVGYRLSPRGRVIVDAWRRERTHQHDIRRTGDA